MKLQPVVPFEPISTDRLPQGKEWIAQLKWDGVRMLVYYDGEETRLVNRKLNDRTMQYPELLDVPSYCEADSVVLDGEIIAMEGPKPSFHQVMKRDSLRTAGRIPLARRQVPVVYMVFDILHYNGAWITEKPLWERQQLLEKIIRPTPGVQLVPSYKEIEGLFEVVKQHRLEGIVCKDIGSVYTVNGKDRRWLKKKLIRDLVAVVGGVTHRAGTVNALLLGLYDDDGKLWYIGHAGTGKLTQQDWKAVTERARGLAVANKPFVNQPERSKDATWIQPAMTAKIHFMEWTHNRTLRQPSIQAFVDIAPEQCTFSTV